MMARAGWARALAAAGSALALALVVALGCGKYGPPVRVQKKARVPAAAAEPTAEPATQPTGASAGLPVESDPADKEAEPKSQP